MKVTKTKENYTFLPETETEARTLRTMVAINKWKVEENPVDKEKPPLYTMRLTPDGKEEKVPVICMECKDASAVTQYGNGGHLVCQSCDDSMNRFFDEEYR